MKLKRLLAGILTGALMITGIPALGLDMAAVPVYAEEEPSEGETTPGHDEKFPNLATDKEVRVSGTFTDTKDIGQNAVDDDLKTQWTSVALNPNGTKSSQWIQIDLEAPTTDVEKIEVVYGSLDDEANIWDQGYIVETYDSERNTTEHVVKTVGANGPDTSIGTDTESRTGNVDTIMRNDSGQTITLSRYLKFTFSLPSSYSGTDPKRVTISEIRVFGSEGMAVYGPEIILKKPEAGKYAEVADVILPEEAKGVHHEVLTGLTYPYATLIRQNSGERSVVDHSVGDPAKTVQVNQWTGGDAVVLEEDEIFLEGGRYGFNAPVQTPGTNNKFDVWGPDIKIITCQVYFKDSLESLADNATLDLFGYSDKMAVQMSKSKLYTYMEAANGSWPEQDIKFGTGEVPALADLVGKWHDLLIVVDGKGKQRLYFDGICSTTDRADENAIPAEEPGKGLHPFTLGFNYAAADNKGSIITANENTFNTQLAKINAKAFTKEYGYLARFDFYTNKNYYKFPNDDTGSDISDAATLSSAFEDFSIDTLETQVGAGNKNDVYKIITNKLQKEPQTGRISICPYKFNTVWSKQVNGTWTDMEADEKFTSADDKYRATVTLQADPGFIFDLDSSRHIQEALDELPEFDDTNGNAQYSVRIFDKRRQLVVYVYYNCGESDIDESCQINNLIIGSNPIKLVAGAEPVSVGADVTMYSKCGTHSAAELKFEYELSDNTKGVSVTEDGMISATRSTKAVIGYEPIQLTVKAYLVLNDEIVMSNGGTTRVEVTRTVDVEVDPVVEEQTLTHPIAITAQAPKAGKYPEVVEVGIDPEAQSHFTTIEDRMSPSASLDALTQDYIRNSQYIKQGTGSGGSQPANPTETWISAWQNDSVIENIDGVWAFNAIGQLSGDNDKFDVFNTDIKLVSFKFYLKQWPTKDSTQTNTNPTALDVYGKGNQYAFQVTSDKTLFMFMENRNGGWPTEIFTPDDTDAFLNKWHNVFMVVDGKGWQRLYIDGKPSATRGGNNSQGSAYAADPTGYARKPFSLGYNSKSNNPNWYRNIFTKEYGYIADFEFYTDKNYSGIIDGDGIDISEANTLNKTLTDNINLQQLEAKYGDNVGIVLTNMLQTSNAAATITATPYVAKTNWYQETLNADGTGTGEFEMLDKENPTPFGYSAKFRSVTTLTAFEGFKFSNTADFTKSIEDAFHTQGGAEATSIEATVGPDDLENADRRLTIVATYGETEEAPCDCEIAVVTPPAPVAIEIPEEEDTVTADLPAISVEDVAITCQKKDHPLSGRVLFSWAVASGSEDKIEINESNKIVAKKAGTATLKLTATFQTGNDEDGWTTYQNEDGEDVTTTVNVTVTVTKEGAASETEKTELGSDVTEAKKDYPDSVEDDYKPAEWAELKAAIEEADALSKNPNATSSAITAAKQRLADAIAALANAKSDKGLAKDALNGVLNNADLKALLATENKDKKYTADSWKKLTDAYANATAKVNTANAAELGTLKSTLETAWKGLVPDTTPVTGGTVKDGDVLTGADKTQYKVASSKDKTVIVTKGVDAKSIKVGPTVVIKNETYKVIGIGDKAYTGLKKATKVVIDANVVSIGAQAFANSKKLKNVTIGQDVTTIGKKAFFKCPKLAKVTVKNNSKLSKVGGSAFKKASKNIKIKLPKNLKKNNKLKKQIKKAGIKKGL